MSQFASDLGEAVNSVLGGKKGNHKKVLTATRAKILKLKFLEDEECFVRASKI